MICDVWDGALELQPAASEKDESNIRHALFAL